MVNLLTKLNHNYSNISHKYLRLKSNPLCKILPKNGQKRHDVVKFIVWPIGSINIMAFSVLVSNLFAVALVVLFIIVAYIVFEIKCPNCNKRVVENKVFFPKKCRHCGYEL